MTLSFSLKYQHLSVQHMATNATHAQCRGGAPRQDTFQAIHSLQVLRHLAKGRGLLSRAPHIRPPRTDGIKILQVYSHEISHRMLDTVKTRASSTAASSVVDIGTALQTPSLEAASATAISEDKSPIVTES